ncbi:MAG: patatin-like phospholipase family protein [Gammaproteobacteria bacterium]|nr:patatin-like phospholipase family protein [Gammaproteobacteria bacterium]
MHDDSGRGRKLGLVLPGGGARAAYQAGVLSAIAELLPSNAANPFPIITGTSAGAINAAFIATNAGHFSRGVEQLAGVWKHIHSDQVFRTDSLTILRNAMYWLLALINTNFAHNRPLVLLDNSPLRRLLEQHIVFARMSELIDGGSLEALAITCSGYTSARAVTFYQGRTGLMPWQRTRRLGQPAELRLDHIMASVSLPALFPAVRIDREYFGDGSLRQAAPLSPAVHLGANRLLVIGVRDEQPNRLPDETEQITYPPLGQIAGYLLDVIFSDRIYTDLERLQRINATIAHMSRQELEEQPLRSIDTLVIVPSDDIREIARRHMRELPSSMRLLLRAMGGLHKSGSQLLSYLLFEAGYCQELTQLGRKDGLAQADKIIRFLADDAGEAR